MPFTAAAPPRRCAPACGIFYSLAARGGARARGRRGARGRGALSEGRARTKIRWKSVPWSTSTNFWFHSFFASSGVRSDSALTCQVQYSITFERIGLSTLGSGIAVSDSVSASPEERRVRDHGTVQNKPVEAHAGRAGGGVGRDGEASARPRGHVRGAPRPPSPSPLPPSPSRRPRVLTQARGHCGIAPSSISLMVTAWHATSLETEKTSLSPDCSLTESSSAIVSSGYGLCVMRQKAGAVPSERAG